MYVLGAFTILYALPRKSMLILSLSFLIQIIFTPQSGTSLSFVLSYLAMLGILITGKALSSLLAGKIPGFILNPFSISVGAFLATAPVVSFTFGMIAPIGIIASLTIVPLTAVFMIVSILWLVLDMFSLSILLGFPLSFIYRLMEIIAGFAGNIQGISANPYLILIVSVVLSLLIVALEYRRRIKLLHLQPFS
jgi:competence protein ComEC